MTTIIDRKEDESLMTLSMLSERVIAQEIDDLLIVMNKAGEKDYSRAIARVFLLMSIADTKSHIEAFCQELMMSAATNSSNGLNGRFILIKDLEGIIDRFLEPIKEMASDQCDEMQGIMSIQEMDAFRNLCGG